jgi:hypothetical protein
MLPFSHEENRHPRPGIGIIEGLQAARAARTNANLDYLERRHGNLIGRLPEMDGTSIDLAMGETVQPNWLELPLNPNDEEAQGPVQPLHRIRRTTASTDFYGDRVLYGPSEASVAAAVATLRRMDLERNALSQQRMRLRQAEERRRIDEANRVLRNEERIAEEERYTNRHNALKRKHHR